MSTESSLEDALTRVRARYVEEPAPRFDQRYRHFLDLLRNSDWVDSAQLPPAPHIKVQALRGTGSSDGTLLALSNIGSLMPGLQASSLIRGDRPVLSRVNRSTPGQKQRVLHQRSPVHSRGPKAATPR